MRPKQRNYSEHEDDYIRSHYRTTPHAKIAIHLHRHVVSIRKRAGKLGVSKPLKRWSEKEDEIIRAEHGKRTWLSKVAKLLGRGESEVSSRAKKIGITKWRIRSGLHSGRPITGFSNGSPIFVHRAIIEKHLGRQLERYEIVHHINFNKNDNSIENLHVLSRSKHRTAHSSFEAIVPELVSRGIIRFNRKTELYELCVENHGALK